jgi:hypothetical protein
MAILILSSLNNKSLNSSSNSQFLFKLIDDFLFFNYEVDFISIDYKDDYELNTSIKEYLSMCIRNSYSVNYDYSKTSILFKFFLKFKLIQDLFYDLKLLKKNLNYDVLTNEYSEVYVIMNPNLSHFLAFFYRKLIPTKTKFIYIWFDPISHSFINYKKLPLKRIPLFFYEKHILKQQCQTNSEIRFLTYTLHKYQNLIFPFIKTNSSFYVPTYSNLLTQPKNKLVKVFGHVGTLYEKYRNYKPFIDFIESNDQFNFIAVGKTDLISNCSRIKVSNALIPSFLAKRIENNCDVLVVFLNNSGFQIPGKVFQYIKLNKPILIIENGIYSEEIKLEINKLSGNFYFCKNNLSEIYRTINYLSRIIF